MNKEEKARYLSQGIEDFVKDTIGVDCDLGTRICTNKKNICGKYNEQCPFGEEFPFGGGFSTDDLDRIDYIKKCTYGKTLAKKKIFEQEMKTVFIKYTPYLQCRGDYEEKKAVFDDMLALWRKVDTSMTNESYASLNIDMIRQRWDHACVLDNGRDVDLGGGEYAQLRDPQQVMESKRIIAELYQILEPYEIQIKNDANDYDAPSFVNLLNGIIDTYHKDVEFVVNTPAQLHGNTDDISSINGNKQPTGLNKRGRRAKSFKDCFLRDTKEADCELVKSLCNNKKGKDLALVILVAIQEGIMSKPTFNAITNECVNIGSGSGFLNYMAKGLRYYTQAEISGMKRCLLG